MSIEAKLKEEFKEYSRSLVCPPAIDMRIIAVFRDYSKEMNRKGRRRKMHKSSILVLLIILVAVLCGFAYLGGKQLFQWNGKQMYKSVTAFEELRLNPAEVQKISRSLNDVKNELKPGELGIVYFAELEKVGLYKTMPIFPVSHPKIIDNLNVWRDILSTLNLTGPLSDTLLETFRLEKGMEAPPFGANVGPEAMKLVTEMKQERMKSSQDILWRRITNPSKPLLHSYTSIYSNPDHESIYVTLEKADLEPGKKMAIKLKIPTSTKYESIDINKHQASFIRSEDFVFNTRNYYQEINWVKEVGENGTTLIYRIGSDSKTLTKEQLIEAAKVISNH